MPRTKTANMYPKAWLMECPYEGCHSMIYSSTGSSYWTEEEVFNLEKQDYRMTCPECGKEVSIPQKARF